MIQEILLIRHGEPVPDRKTPLALRNLCAGWRNMMRAELSRRPLRLYRCPLKNCPVISR